MNDEAIWSEPTSVTAMSEHLATIVRLSKASAAKYRNSEATIDWEVPASDRYFKSEESLALYGTPYWDLLEARDRRRLAFLEVVHSWSDFLHVETFAVTLLSNIVLREYTKRAQGIPEEVIEYWTHFCKEELVHTLMFRRALKHLRSPRFPDGILNVQLLFGGLQWVSVATLAMLAEWLQEELQWRTSTGAEIDPLVRQIVTSHHVEEARHIRFGREVVAAYWRSLSADEREKVLPLVAAVLRISLDDLAAHRDVLRAMEFTRPELQDVDRVAEVARTSEYRVELNKRLFGRIFTFLRDVDIYNSASAPIFANGGIEHYLADA